MRIYIPHISPIVSRRFTILIRELKQPRRRRQQKPQKFAYSAMKNSIFARFARAFFIFFARAFFIFWHFVLVLSATWNDQFCSWVDNVSAWWQMFNFAFLCPKRWFQFNSRIVRTHFSSKMTLNNCEIIAETGSYIFRWRSRFRRRRVCLSSLLLNRRTATWNLFVSWFTLRLNGTLHLTFTKIESASNYSVHKGKMDNSYTGLGEYTALSQEMGVLVS